MIRGGLKRYVSGNQMTALISAKERSYLGTARNLRERHNLFLGAAAAADSSAADPSLARLPGLRTPCGDPGS